MSFKKQYKLGHMKYISIVVNSITLTMLSLCWCSWCKVQWSAGAGSFACQVFGTYNTSALQAALATRIVLSVIQGTVVIFKALHSLGPRCIWDCLQGCHFILLFLIAMLCYPCWGLFNVDFFKILFICFFYS